jgi:hypothetical protein
MGTSSIRADININYAASAGFYTDDPAIGLVDPSGSFLVQLIYTPSGYIGHADVRTPGFVTGDNQVLSAYTVGFNVPGTDLTSFSTFGDFNAGSQVYSGALEGGFVFVRVFDTADPATDFVKGSRLYDSDTLLTTAFTGIQAPQLLQVNTDIVNGNRLDIVLLPEPSVLAFMGIGALLMAVRRRRA